MPLEDYFDFQRPDDIRVRGTRVGIEPIIYELIHPPVVKRLRALAKQYGGREQLLAAIREQGRERFLAETMEGSRGQSVNFLCDPIPAHHVLSAPWLGRACRTPTAPTDRYGSVGV